jgi:hypothetical protein
MTIIHHTVEEKDQAACHLTIMIIWEQQVPAGEILMVPPEVILLPEEEHLQPASWLQRMQGEVLQVSHRVAQSNQDRMRLKVKMQLQDQHLHLRELL